MEESSHTRYWMIAESDGVDNEPSESMRAPGGNLKRHADGEPLRVLDLFSGCGGLSLGFLSAGCQMVGGLERDRSASATFTANLAPADGEAGFIGWDPLDIRQVEPAQLLKKLSGTDPADAVDVIVGGPPCQAFSRVGRAKLREVADHPEAWQLDDRASLHEHYLRFVAVARPLIVLMENVPEILDHGGENLPEAIAQQLSTLGYRVRYTLLNAAHYGVPQVRERLFLLGIDGSVGVDPSFPRPTHQVDLSSGYREKRAWFAGLAGCSKTECRFAVLPPESSGDLPPATTTRQALANLPPITSHLEDKLKAGRRNQERELEYHPGRPSNYSKLMRYWPGMPRSESVTAHVIRRLPRDFPIFARMQPGDQYPQALAIAEELLEARLAHVNSNGDDPTSLRKRVVPPYDPTKFPNKWQKLDPDSPAHTLTAHLGRDSYSHIHFSSEEARTISVREAARLQSFPDSFCFHGGMNDAFRQIGNAVAPLLARAIAHELLSRLSREPGRRQSTDSMSVKAARRARSAGCVRTPTGPE